MVLELAVLAIAGLAAGYVNAVAGAGSLLTLPALIFTGLDPSAANATNRIAIFFNNVTAVTAYHRGGLKVKRLALPLLVPLAVSAAAGAWVATLLSERQLKLAIAVAMVTFLVLSFVPRRKREDDGAGDDDAPPELPPFHWTMVLGFAGIGFYAGFLQAGVGVLILLYMSLVHGGNLVASNFLKSFSILVFTVIALGVFVVLGEHIDLFRGLVLAAGTATGGYLGAVATLRRGEKFVRVLLVVAVVASVAKLAWDSL